MVCRNKPSIPATGWKSSSYRVRIVSAESGAGNKLVDQAAGRMILTGFVGWALARPHSGSRRAKAHPA